MDSAFQGREGLEMVKQAAAKGDPYALAFVDVRMPPGWDGVETISTSMAMLSGHPNRHLHRLFRLFLGRYDS